MLDQLLRWLGFGLCHQLPERSFFGGGTQVPVCARDTGIYVGFVISLVVISIIHRGERPRGFPRSPVWIVMGVLLALMAWDGLSSYAGFRSTGNAIRLFTGLGTGFSAAVVLFPILQDELWNSASTGRVLDPRWRFFVWLAAMPLSFAFVWWVAPLLGVAYPMLTALMILVTLTTLNLVIVAMLPAFDRKASSWKQVLLPATLALLIAIAEIALAGQLRVFLEGLVTAV